MRAWLMIASLAASFVVAASAVARAQATAAPATGASVDASSALAEISTLYSDGHFELASRRLNELLAIDAELRREERAQVYLLKARLELAFGRKDELKLWLGKAHEANPNLALDPVRDPPQLHAVWEEVKKTAKPQEKPAAAVAKPAKTPEKPAAPPPAEAPVEEPGSFWVGLLPLGAGHFNAGRYKDGGLFLSTELLLLLASNTLTQNDDDDADKAGRVHPRAPEILGSLSLLGAYGYELVDMLPDLERRDAAATSSLRGVLRVLPFGVGQATNGAYMKAFGFGSVQAVFLTFGTLAPQDRQRRLALGAFGLAWAYGVLDAYTGAPQAQKTGLALGILPVASAGGAPGAALVLRYQGW